MAIRVPINIKKVKEDAVIPQYETDNAAGFDFRAHTNGETVVLPPASVEKVKKGFFKRELKLVPSRTLIKTGLAVALPEGFELQVRSRSGLALKQGIQAHLGTVDADYRGEVGIILFNHGSEPLTIAHGDRIAQGIINEIKQAGFNEVEELNETARGTGGFGSTGGSEALVEINANDTAGNVVNTADLAKLTQGVRL